MEKFTDKNVSNIMLGGEASVALGLLGRTATGEAYLAASGPSNNSEAYMSYSHSRGGYAGVTLDAAYRRPRGNRPLGEGSRRRRRRRVVVAVAASSSPRRCRVVVVVAVSPRRRRVVVAASSRRRRGVVA